MLKLCKNTQQCNSFIFHRGICLLIFVFKNDVHKLLVTFIVFKASHWESICLILHLLYTSWPWMFSNIRQVFFLHWQEILYKIKPLYRVLAFILAQFNLRAVCICIIKLQSSEGLRALHFKLKKENNINATIPSPFSWSLYKMIGSECLGYNILHSFLLSNLRLERWKTFLAHWFWCLYIFNEMVWCHFWNQQLPLLCKTKKVIRINTVLHFYFKITNLRSQHFFLMLLMGDPVTV